MQDQGAKMFAKIFLGLIVVFVLIAIYLSFKNNFSTEIEGLLFKAIGAVAVGLYFIVNSFIVNPKPEKEIKVSTPMLYERNSGTVVAPYTRHTGNRPEESAMFSGLNDLNTVMLYNVFQGMPVWQKLKTHSNQDNNDLERLEILEFVFFHWLVREVSWLKVSEVKSFSESGWGGGANIMEQTEKNSSEIELDKISNPNMFISKYPIKLVLPTGSSLERNTNKHSVNIKISTDTGEFSIQFFTGLGGDFQHNPSSKLSNMLNNYINFQLRSVQNKNIWLDYPQIAIKYKPFRRSQYSEQTNREEAWLSKIEKYLYKDYSWDLLREYYSVDFQAALNLFRNKYGELN